MLQVAGDGSGVAAVVGAHGQVFGDGQAGEDAAALGHQRQSLADQFMAGKRRGLAGTVGADQADDLVFLDGEGNALDGNDAAIVHFEIQGFNERLCQGRPR